MLNAVLESFAVVVAALACALLGRELGRREDKRWLIGVIVPLLFLFGAAANGFFRELSFVPPFTWLYGGWRGPVVRAVAASMLLGVLATKADSDQDKRGAILYLLAAFFVFRVSVLPILASAVKRDALSKLDGRANAQGLCQQSTPYTCGPCAAVMALHQVGIESTEGQMAVLFHTTEYSGTPDDIAADALRAEYESKGLRVKRRYLRSVEDLPPRAIWMAVMKDSLLSDHMVTILKRNQDTLTVGDPVAGLITLSTAEFEQHWRHVAVVLWRN